jgi:hypothetical protein
MLLIIRIAMTMKPRRLPRHQSAQVRNSTLRPPPKGDDLKRVAALIAPNADDEHRVATDSAMSFVAPHPPFLFHLHVGNDRAPEAGASPQLPFFLEAFCDISHRLGGITPFGFFSDAFPGLKMLVTFACATANFLTHFIISIAVLENVPPDTGLHKRATFPH